MISIEQVKQYLKSEKNPTFRGFCLKHEILSDDLVAIYEEHGEEFKALEYLDLAIKAEVDSNVYTNRKANSMIMRLCVKRYLGTIYQVVVL